MKSIIVILFLIYLLNLHVINGQEGTLNCNYTLSGSTYMCDIFINNPRGFNNFVAINGTHATGKTDDAVTRINPGSGSNSLNVPTIICDKFRSITYINLFNVGIQKLVMENESSFKYCKNLTSLYLYGNKISHTDDNSFSENRELTTLSLYNNQMVSLSENTFANLSKLVNLYLHINKISDLPANIFKPLKVLATLYLSENNFSTLKGEWFEPLVNLKNLYLFGNKIESLPASIFSPLKNLVTIHLYFNRIKIIHSDSFGDLPNLKTLRLDINQVEAIDEDFFHKTGVAYLNMTYNACANEYVTDTTVSKYTMRLLLNQCIENYQAIKAGTTEKLTSIASIATTQARSTVPSECTNENLDKRVCKLENEVISEILDTIEGLQSKVDELSKRPCACS